MGLPGDLRLPVLKGRALGSVEHGLAAYLEGLLYLLYEGKNPHIHRLRNEHRRGWPLDTAKPVLDDLLRRPLRTRCSLDPVRGVVHSPRPDLTCPIGGEKQVSLDQKPLE